LGRCNTAELERRTIAYYDQETPFDQAHYLAQGLQGWEVDAICKHFPSEGRILLAAAGGGRETRALEAMGYEVASFDPSDHLVERFRALTNDNRKILRSAPTAVPSFEVEFDAAIVGWGGYTHIPERARRVVFLRALTAQMRRDAPLLLSFFLRRESPWRSKTFAAAANLIRRVRRLEPVVESGDSMTGKFEHHFLREEVVAELTAGGLKLAEFRAAPFPHAIGLVR
jgi:2-polyprenyl-3-methyl-5-hydroxy-6-metoxy-1,4-benzoquinol methylase